MQKSHFDEIVLPKAHHSKVCDEIFMKESEIQLKISKNIYEAGQ